MDDSRTARTHHSPMPPRHRSYARRLPQFAASPPPDDIVRTIGRLLRLGQDILAAATGAAPLMPNCVINYETFARIHDCRDRQGLTIAQTARALGLHPKPENGRPPCRNPETLNQRAELALLSGDVEARRHGGPRRRPLPSPPAGHGHCASYASPRLRPANRRPEGALRRLPRLERTHRRPASGNRQRQSRACPMHPEGCRSCPGG
jgi:hypothetical protein